MSKHVWMIDFYCNDNLIVEINSIEKKYRSIKTIEKSYLKFKENKNGKIRNIPF